MYKASITTELPEHIVEEVFRYEDRDIQQRASYTIEQKEGKTLFMIDAKDSTALRTVLNAIMRLLTVIEKTKGIA